MTANYHTFLVSEDLSILDYRLNGLPVNEVMSYVKNIIENKLPENLEHCPARVFKKFIDAFGLKKEFRSFAEEYNAEEACKAFIKERVSELLYNVSRWAKIFATEEEDRTNKKHRRHIKEMLPYLNEIIKINLFFSKAERQTFSSSSSFAIKKNLNKNFSIKNSQ